MKELAEIYSNSELGRFGECGEWVVKAYDGIHFIPVR
jgi:hypothetical protein